MNHPAVEFIAEQDIPNALARAGDQVYESRWNQRLQHAAGRIGDGDTTLARVVADLMAVQRDGLTEQHNFIWLGEIVPANPMLMEMQRRVLLSSILLQHLTAQTDSIVELGSGDGLNLFALWLATGPRDARYLGFEIAETGRLCTELLGKLEPAMRVTAHRFDYYEPDYDAIPDGQRHMLVFTHGSVEQIATLPETAITGLLDKADSVTGVHIEPVGWQLHADDRHKARCLSLGYNENFWALLTDLQARGRLVIDRTIINISGKLKHPSTLIEWHKAA